jgi:antibiotic biosynthesis monooxygenase (ABM) superfamily enzyme
MAVMIWLAAFPTLTVLQLLLKGVLAEAPVVLRTLVLATIAVPIVIYGLLPPLLRLRTHVVTRRGAERHAAVATDRNQRSRGSVHLPRSW